MYVCSLFAFGLFPISDSDSAVWACGCGARLCTHASWGYGPERGGIHNERLAQTESLCERDSRKAQRTALSEENGLQLVTRGASSFPFPLDALLAGLRRPASCGGISLPPAVVASSSQNRDGVSCAYPRRCPTHGRLSLPSSRTLAATLNSCHSAACRQCWSTTLTAALTHASLLVSRPSTRNMSAVWRYANAHF